MANGSTTSTDLEKVINFMEEDFSDGRFDGKKVDDATGKIATMSTTDFGGVVASKQAADDFLKRILRQHKQNMIVLIPMWQQPRMMNFL